MKLKYYKRSAVIFVSWIIPFQAEDIEDIRDIQSRLIGIGNCPTSVGQEGELLRLNIEYLKGLAENGGPVENQYEELGTLYKSINSKRKKGIMTDSEMLSIWQALPDVFCTTDTMQGYALLKPHGYSGDFVIIERIYQ